MLQHPSKYTLEEIEQHVWESLQKGVQLAKDDFYTGTVATIGLDNTIQQRTVVLRKIIPTEQTLFFYTDVRSQKIKEIEKNSRISFLFYHREQQIQLSFQGNATLHRQNELTESLWKETSIGSRKIYLSEMKSGEVITGWKDGFQKDIRDKRLSLEETEIGKKNFVVVKVKMKKLDWLSLHPAGHARAIFEWACEKKFYWVIP